MNPRKARACGWAAACIACFTTAAVQAQAPAAQDLTTLSIEELTTVKVYSASRHLETAQEAPSAVTVITAEEISRYGWRTLADVLNSVRGFYTANDRTYTYIGSQGFMRPGDLGTGILLMINGHRENDNVYGESLVGTEFPLDLELVERIEIVRGPSSSLYGTNAMIAVINVITRSPSAQKQPLTFDASGEADSFDARRAQLTGSITHGTLSAMLGGSMYDSEGAPRLFYPEYDFPATNFGIADNIDGDRAAKAFTDITYGNWRVEGLWGSRRKIIPTADYGTTFNDPGTRTTDSRGFVDIAYKAALSPATDLDARGYFDAVNHAGTYAEGGEGSLPRFLDVDKGNEAALGFETMVGHQFGRNRITVGGLYEDSYRIKMVDYFQGGQVNLNTERSLWLTAVYGEAELRPLERLTIRAGGRMDEYALYGASFSPRAAAILTLPRQTELKYIFGKAFRAPTAFETFYGDQSTMEPNLGLRPETTTSHEIVLEHHFAPWLTATGETFYSLMHNGIDQSIDSATGMLWFINSDRNESLGVEAEVDAKRSSGLEARASYTWNYASDDVREWHLTNSPMNLAKANTTVPVWHGGVAAGELLYVSSQTSVQQTKVPSYLLANFTLSTKPLWNSWELSASVYNAFDRRWYAPAAPSYLQSMILQDGRSMRIKLTYRLPAREGGK